MAGKIKEAKDLGGQAMEASKNSGTIQIVSEMVTGSERMLRALEEGKYRMNKHIGEKFSYDEIGQLPVTLIKVLDELYQVNLHTKERASKMLKHAAKRETEKFQTEMAELMVQTSQDTVSVEENYHFIFQAAPMVLYSVYKSNNNKVEPNITKEEIDSLKEEIVLYYGDDVKNGLKVGAKHIDSVGAALWQGLSNIENAPQSSSKVD